jgi:hypothetical protein
LKIPRQCPLTLSLKIDKDKVKRYEVNFVMRGGNKLSSASVEFGRNSDFTVGSAAYEVRSATWSLGTNSSFAVGPRETTKYFYQPEMNLSDPIQDFSSYFTENSLRLHYRDQLVKLS